MAETFTKLFSSILQSSVWQEDTETRIVWITMLAMADKNGYVGAAVTGLAHQAGVSVAATEAALQKFLSPDPYSRSQEDQGRRIEVTDRGWVLLNYERFRDMRDEEARRAYERHRKREQRARAKARTVPAVSRRVPQCHENVPMSAQAEAEAEAEAESVVNNKARAEPAASWPQLHAKLPVAGLYRQQVMDFLASVPERNAEGWCKVLLQTLAGIGTPGGVAVTPDELLTTIATYTASRTGDHDTRYFAGCLRNVVKRRHAETPKGTGSAAAPGTGRLPRLTDPSIQAAS